jgi:protein SCO1/2
MALATRVGIVVSCLLAFGPSPWIADAGKGASADDIRALPLVDQHGKITTLRALEGRTLVLHFIFTHCVAACHTQVKSLKAVREALPAETRARVQFLSVSLDPERDTPETLSEYARRMAVDDPDWRFVTTSPDHLAQLARALGVKRQALPDGQMDHTLVVMLFDAKGSLFQRYARAEVNVARLVREINDVVRLYDPAYQPTSGIGQGR